jgi:hypothetical protein
LQRTWSDWTGALFKCLVTYYAPLEPLDSRATPPANFNFILGIFSVFIGSRSILQLGRKRTSARFDSRTRLGTNDSAGVTYRGINDHSYVKKTDNKETRKNTNKVKNR